MSKNLVSVCPVLAEDHSVVVFNPHLFPCNVFSGDGVARRRWRRGRCRRSGAWKPWQQPALPPLLEGPPTLGRLQPRKEARCPTLGDPSSKMLSTSARCTSAERCSVVLSIAACFALPHRPLSCPWLPPWAGRPNAGLMWMNASVTPSLLLFQLHYSSKAIWLRRISLFSGLLGSLVLLQPDSSKLNWANLCTFIAAFSADINTILIRCQQIP